MTALGGAGALGARQRTLGRPVRVAGRALRHGGPVAVELLPAPPDHGRVLLVEGTPVPAVLERVVDTRLATTLGDGARRVTMVEHLLAALAALGVDNCLIVVEGGEVPVLDGSAAGWMQALGQAGLRAQGRARAVWRPAEVIEVREGESAARVEPAEALELDLTIDFPHPLIGTQRWVGRPDAVVFARELAPARTFGFLRDAEALRAAGMALGASLENTVVYDTTSVLNPEGLRWPDEAVRHKALDTVGDLALLGVPIAARITAHRPGHALHRALLIALRGAMGGAAHR